MTGIEGSPEIQKDVSDIDPDMMQGFGKRGVEGVVEVTHIGDMPESGTTKTVDSIEAMRLAEIARIQANGTLG